MNVAVGGAHSGSRLAVSSDGFILTNRHVAAAWETAYEFPPSANGGIIPAPAPTARSASSASSRRPRAMVARGSKQDGIAYDGRNDRLDVSFASPNRRLAGKLSAVSPRTTWR